MPDKVIRERGIQILSQAINRWIMQRNEKVSNVQNAVNPLYDITGKEVLSAHVNID